MSVEHFCPKMAQWSFAQNTAIRSKWSFIPPIFWEPCTHNVSRKVSVPTKIWRFLALTRRCEAWSSTGCARWQRAFTSPAEPCITQFRSLISFCPSNSKPGELKWSKTWSCSRGFHAYLHPLRTMKWTPPCPAPRSSWGSFPGTSRRSESCSMSIRHTLATATIKNSTQRKMSCASRSNTS